MPTVVEKTVIHAVSLFRCCEGEVSVRQSRLLGVVRRWAFSAKDSSQKQAHRLEVETRNWTLTAANHMAWMQALRTLQTGQGFAQYRLLLTQYCAVVYIAYCAQHTWMFFNLWHFWPCSLLVYKYIYMFNTSSTNNVQHGVCVCICILYNVKWCSNC